MIKVNELVDAVQHPLAALLAVLLCCLVNRLHHRYFVGRDRYCRVACSNGLLVEDHVVRSLVDVSRTVVYHIYSSFRPLSDETWSSTELEHVRYCLPLARPLERRSECRISMIADRMHRWHSSGLCCCNPNPNPRPRHFQCNDKVLQYILDACGRSKRHRFE